MKFRITIFHHNADLINKMRKGKMALKSVALAASALILSTSTNASQVMPVSYDMPNGGSADSTYWDDSYTGSGDNETSYAALSGGLGDLTDGNIATDNWNVDNTPYVGWLSVIPTITFHFGSATSIDSISIYADDSDGTGGVFVPASITIAGINYPVTDPVGSVPTVLTFTGLGLNVSDLDITINQQTSSWVMVSEITFETAVVPVPAAMWLFGSGLIGLIGFARRKASQLHIK